MEEMFMDQENGFHGSDFRGRFEGVNVPLWRSHLGLGPPNSPTDVGKTMNRWIDG